MQLVRFVFAVGQMMAFVGGGYALALTLYHLITGKFDPKKDQQTIMNGIHSCFLGIFIMVVALLYGLFGVLK